jgi:acyl transferase domain-containing protein
MKGAFLASEDARLFDHAFFGMTPMEVETMDPSQRKLLEVAYEAIENAGETWESVSGSRTGVFVGNFCLDHWMIQSRDWDNPRPYAFTGAGTSILANRISYIFNFHGPRYVASYVGPFIPWEKVAVTACSLPNYNPV